MSARNTPQPRQRPSARFGPIHLPTRLDQPEVASTDEARQHEHQPTGEPTVVQNMGEGVPTYSASGTAFLEHANAFDDLVAGGPFQVVTDSATGGAADSGMWCFCKSVSTSPYKWLPSPGQWGYTYDLELLETQPPGNGTPRHALPINGPTSTASRPTPRPEIDARIGGIELPNPINRPRVSVDGKARIKTYDRVGKTSVARWQGVDERTLTINGPCYRQHVPRFRSLTSGDRIEIRTDRFQGNVAVKSVNIDPEEIRYAPGQWGRQYTIELRQVAE